MQKKILCMVMAAMFLIASVVTAAEIQGNGYIEVKGEKYLDPGKSMDEMRRMAILDGYRLLAEAIGDLHISSDSSMSTFSNLNDQVRAEVEKVIHGAKVINVQRDNEKFIATVRLNVFGGANSLANVVVPKEVKVEPFPEFNPTFLTIGSDYTGLIIDCSKADDKISTAVLPKIQSMSGKEVYAFKYLDRNLVVNRGMVRYSDNPNSGVNRAGNNPLTIQAMEISGDCDVIVSDDDAEKILAANSKSNFLKNCAVVFVK